MRVQESLALVAGLRRMMQRARQRDIRSFELTAGDSQYSFLSYDETKQLARLVTAAAGDRDTTIIGTGATPVAVERAPS